MFCIVYGQDNGQVPEGLFEIIRLVGQNGRLHLLVVT
jgi:hypothetical protein